MERGRQRINSWAFAERELVLVVFEYDPIAGLGSVVRFAERARVSPPTVTRFITKLGFSGYPEFQETLRNEVQARLSSPVSRYRDNEAGRGTDSVLSDALEVATHNLKVTLDVLSHRYVNEAVELTADVRRRVMVLGGRVSAPLARYLAHQLHLLRPGIDLSDAERSTPAQQLIHMRKGHILVIFDYRPYHP